MSATLEVPAPAAAAAGHPRRWLILFVVLAAECMDLLDSTVVNVAAPAISRDLGATTTALQWIVGGYALTFAIGLITGGRLGDIHGRRRLFLIGSAGFIAASVLCGLAVEPWMLIASRLLQGAFAAILIPQGFGIIKAAFPPDELPKAFGMFGPVMGMAAVCGPIIGGALVDGDLLGTGWRMIFLINVPLGALAFWGAFRVVPESRLPVAPKLDLGGMALVTIATGLLMYPLIQGRELGWPTWTYVAMGASVPLLIAFALYERRRAAAGADPLVMPSLFERRAFSGGLAFAVAFFAGMMGMLLALGLYLQLGRGFTAIHAGLTFIPFSFGVAVGAGLGGGLLAPRFGRHTLHAGTVVMLAGTVWLIACIPGARDALSSWDLVGALAITGVGFGLVVAPYFDTVLAGVKDHEVGAASGTLNAVQQFAGAAGIAVLGTVFFSAVTSAGFQEALQRVLWIDAGLIVVAALLTFLLPMRAREDVLGH
jgi:EmrB/QacA subfamily drug resistance transporter